jgi:GTP pyrophosphokinase
MTTEDFKILNEDIILSERNDWSDDEKKFITKAVKYAQEKHKEQKRNNGEPYANHVISVGKILANLNMDTDTIVAGILHDVLEDTETTEDEMKKEFGDEITFLVKAVTKLPKLKYQGEERYAESLRKFFVSIAEDVRVVVIKLADRLHNMQTLQYVREDKRKRIALETLEIHSKLATKFGMQILKVELEELAFPYAYPDEYKQTKDLLENINKNSDKRLADVVDNIKFVLDTYNVEYLEIQYRLKHLYSLYQKLRKYEMDITKIYDIVALRVILKDLGDCYKTLGLIHSEYKPLPGRIKDYIARPKANGYRSLHTTVFTKDGQTAEIQIRTKEMHDEAEYGIASHLHYKEIGKNKTKEEILQKSSWSKNILEMKKDMDDRDEFMHHLKTDFFERRVFVFTPKGDVIDLPEGASAIDFAYAVHTNIGNKLSAVKINGKMDNIETVLNRGDIVEISTNKKAHPSHKWLEFVKTSFARKQITKAVDKIEKEKAKLESKS